MRTWGCYRQEQVYIYRREKIQNNIKNYAVTLDSCYLFTKRNVEHGIDHDIDNFVYIRRSGTLQQIWCLSSNLSRRWILRVCLFVILQAFFSTVYEGGKFLRSHGGSRILRSIGIK